MRQNKTNKRILHKVNEHYAVCFDKVSTASVLMVIHYRQKSPAKRGFPALFNDNISGRMQHLLLSEPEYLQLDVEYAQVVRRSLYKR